MQSVTGASNAYRHEFAQWLDPAGMVRQSQGADAPLKDVLRSLQDTGQGLAITRIVYPPNPRGTYFVYVQDAGDSSYMSVDPGNAEILRSGGLWTFPAEGAARLHYNFTIGLPGIVIVAITGLACLVMLFSGLIYWWPRSARKIRQLSINWNLPGKFVLRQLHRSTGVVMSLFLSYSIITGLVIAVDYAIDGFLSAPASPVGLPTDSEIDLDEAIRQAQSRFPENEIRDVRFVAAARADVFFRAPELSPRAVHLVSIDLKSLTVARVEVGETNNELWVTWLPLHTGESLGFPGLVLIVCNAIVLLLLAATGPIMWLNRIRKRRSVRSNQ